MNQPLRKTRSSLSRSRDPGTNALNGYHTAGQLLGIYSLGAKRNRDESLESAWSTSVESLVQNIGALYDLWSLITKEGDYGIATPESPGLTNRLWVLSQRLARISAAIHEWTLGSKVASVLLRCEASWQVILDQFKVIHSAQADIINRLLSDSRNRVRLLRMAIAASGRNRVVTTTTQNPDDLLNLTVDDF